MVKDLIMDYSSSYTNDSGSDPGIGLIPGYEPFIADVGLTASCEPLQIPNPDTRSDAEIDRIRHSLRQAVSTKEFEKPISLADFCLVAPSKWEDDESSDVECSIRVCLLL